MKREPFVELEDYYVDENGFVVLTEQYLARRGFCCGMGCRHCPYNHINVPGRPTRTDDNPNEST